jgi:phosphatidylserine decarboxylase
MSKTALAHERRAWHEGLPFIVGSFTASAVLARRSPPLALASAAFGMACVGFFRDPDFEVHAGPDDVLSAADGTVLATDRIKEPWFIRGEADRIVVFLSILDAHVNRSPVAGRLVGLRKIPGAFAPAFMYAENNCRDMLAIEGEHGPVVVAQISGVLARRSVQWRQVGESLEVGDRFGMIRFGSRTDVYLPAGSADILVSAGQRVRAGRTLIARYQ